MLSARLPTSRTTANASGSRSSRVAPWAKRCLNSEVFPLSWSSDSLEIEGSRLLMRTTRGWRALMSRSNLLPKIFLRTVSTINGWSSYQDLFSSFHIMSGMETKSREPRAGRKLFKSHSIGTPSSSRSIPPNRGSHRSRVLQGIYRSLTFGRREPLNHAKTLPDSRGMDQPGVAHLNCDRQGAASLTFPLESPILHWHCAEPQWPLSTHGNQKNARSGIYWQRVHHSFSYQVLGGRPRRRHPRFLESQS